MGKVILVVGYERVVFGGQGDMVGRGGGGGGGEMAGGFEDLGGLDGESESF